MHPVSFPPPLIRFHLVSAVRSKFAHATLPCFRGMATGLFLALASWLQSAVEPVQISEFMAANNGGLRDEDGGSPDWIELHNSGGSISLDGWFLTNDPNQLNLWRIPRVALQRDDRLVVFASGKNRNLNTNQLHASFRLQREGGFWLWCGWAAPRSP